MIGNFGIFVIKLLFKTSVPNNPDNKEKIIMSHELESGFFVATPDGRAWAPSSKTRLRPRWRPSALQHYDANRFLAQRSIHAALAA